jgi:hypothetical protein
MNGVQYVLVDFKAPMSTSICAGILIHKGPTWRWSLIVLYVGWWTTSAGRSGLTGKIALPSDI